MGTSLPEWNGSCGEIDRMAQTVPVEAPWLAPEADAWDRVTVGAWYDSQGLSPVARTLLEICTVGILSVPTVEVSLLDLLFNVQVCGVSAELLAESEGGAQTKRFVGGTSQIPLRLAERLKESHPAESPVVTIDHAPDRVTVTCRGGNVATGRQVIVALSPTLAGRIMYRPAATRCTGPADPTSSAGLRAQNVRVLPRAVLARRRLERPADLGGGARANVQRQLPARGGRRAGNHPGLPRG